MTKPFWRRLALFTQLARAVGGLLARILAGAFSAEPIASADHVVVHKAERKLYLYHGTQLLGVYKVALGLSPVGQKERERDFRTPEGRYYLARRNTRSDYFPVDPSVLPQQGG